MSGRRLISLWRHLPNDSALSREFDPHGALQSRWTTTDHLLAALSEQVDGLYRLTYYANGGKNNNGIKPVRHPRPELPLQHKPKPKNKRSANAAEVRAILRGELR